MIGCSIDVHHEVGGAGLIRRRPQQARGGDARQVVAEEERPLHRRQLQRLRAQHRIGIGGDEVAHAGIAALDREAVHIAFHHIDGEDAVADPLGRHVGAGDDVAARAVLRLDLVGDVEDVAEAHLLADERLVERPQLLGREHGGAGDPDILELEAELVHRARHRRAPRRLDAEVEVVLRRRRGQRPVAPGLHRPRQSTRNRLSQRRAGRQQADQRHAQDKRTPPTTASPMHRSPASIPPHPPAPSPRLGSRGIPGPAGVARRNGYHRSGIPSTTQSFNKELRM